jgi:hypothetical protein
MKPISSLIGAVVGLATLAALGYACWLVIHGIVGVFAGLERELASLVAIACVAALTAAWIIGRGGLGPSEKRRKAEALREEKAATYQLFVDYWESLLRRGRTHSDQIPVDLAGKLHVLERYLALYAGGAVMRAHTSLRELERDKGTHHPDVRVRLCDALIAIRKDLGSEVPPDAVQELERLLLPPAPGTADTPARDSIDARTRTVLAPGA